MFGSIDDTVLRRGGCLLAGSAGFLHATDFAAMVRSLSDRSGSSRTMISEPLPTNLLKRKVLFISYVIPG
jgi:hypothetical protein